MIHNIRSRYRGVFPESMDRMVLHGVLFVGFAFAHPAVSENTTRGFHDGPGANDVPPVVQTGSETMPAGDAVTAAMLQIRHDIEQATAELNQVRETIAGERRPLAERLERLQATVAERRAEAARLQRLRDQSAQQQAALNAETQALEQQIRYLRSLFADYAQAMETRVHAAEAHLLAEPLRDLDDAFLPDASFDELTHGIAGLLDVAQEWNRRRWGGHTFGGTVLDPDGTAHDGTFSVFGPIAFFTSEDETLSGPVFTRPGHILPALGKTFAGRHSEAVFRIHAGQPAVLPIDVTGGDALKIERAGTTLIEQARQGGPVMIPLLAVSFLAFVLAAWKSMDLTRFQVRGGGALQELMERLRKDDVDGARRLSATLKEPLASLVQTLIAFRHAARTDLEEILHEKVLATLPRMERHLGLLAVLGGIAPLLGLLGTVTGMIHTFQLVTLFGSGDARLLSGGISEALTTTAFGLMIAIPVLLVHALLVRKTRTMVGSLEQTAAGMVADLGRKP